MKKSKGIEIRSTVIGFLLWSDSKRFSILLTHNKIVEVEQSFDDNSREELNVEISDE